MAPRMLGRDVESAVIGHVLNQAKTQPAFICITGEAGIGKTTLLEATRETAADEGFTLLSCAPASVEAHMSYAGLTDLLMPLADRLEDLPEPQRLALEAALLRRTRAGRLPDVHAIGAGTLSLLAGRSDQDPVLLTVDDVQWLDEPSLRALIFAVRRC